MTKHEQAIDCIEEVLQYVLLGKGAPVPIGNKFVDADYLAGGLYIALELLKEQEPVSPIRDKGLCVCGNCGNWVYKSDKFCSKCGKAVKWE